MGTHHDSLDGGNLITGNFGSVWWRILKKHTAIEMENIKQIVESKCERKEAITNHCYVRRHRIDDGLDCCCEAKVDKWKLLNNSIQSATRPISINRRNTLVESKTEGGQKKESVPRKESGRGRPGR